MTINEIYEQLKEEYGDSIIELIENPPCDSSIIVKAESIFEVCHTLRDKPGFEFDYLMCLSGLDLGEKLSAVYHLYSMKHAHKVVIKTIVPKDNPKVPSVERIWRTADWHEREAYDLIGIIFEGHHNLIRILCPYDWEGHPLRKDYKEPEYYHEMKVPY